MDMQVYKFDKETVLRLQYREVKTANPGTQHQPEFYMPPNFIVFIHSVPVLKPGHDC